MYVRRCKRINFRIYFFQIGFEVCVLQPNIANCKKKYSLGLCTPTHNPNSSYLVRLLVALVKPKYSETKI